MNGIEQLKIIDDRELINDIIDREREARINNAKVRSSLSSFDKSTAWEYLLFLEKVIEMGNGHLIDNDGWSNFILDNMYTVDRNFEYGGKTCGAHSVDFILQEGYELSLIGRGGHETVYDMNLGIARSIDGYERDHIPVPRECLYCYRFMKRTGKKPFRIFGLFF